MKHLGFTAKIQELLPEKVQDVEVGRIIAEHKTRYVVQSGEGIFNAEITGNLRYSSQSRADFPAVGDWVRFTKMDDENAIILEVLPRFSILERKAVGKFGESQVIAANIDAAFIVQAPGHDFNLKRIERYLTLCYSGGIEPIIVLNKIDLISVVELERLTTQLKERFNKVSTIAISSENNAGYTVFRKRLRAYQTYCFIGSSGVGKSTIVNHLKQEEVLKTSEISGSTNKGRHTTSHRELFILPNKSIVIDTPGMREIGIANQAIGVEITYNNIENLAQRCRFSDCTHSNEKGCAVLEALHSGHLPEAIYENFIKLKREQEHFSSTVHEKRKRDKAFGKMVKDVKNYKRKFRY